jgi:dCTP deaminase
MSILLKDEILKYYKQGDIVLQPFFETHIGPNSYDVRLDKDILVYDFSQMQYLDCKKENAVKSITIHPINGLILQPGILYIGNTVERAGSDKFIPMYEGRSSMARLGIQSHISAGFGDIGFKSQWTLEISVVHPVKVYAGMRIGQIYFHKVNPSENVHTNLYQGKYLNQTGPQPSLSFKDLGVGIL